MPRSYIRVRAVVWMYGRGQTDRQTHRQTRMTTIHFASSTTHTKCNQHFSHRYQSENIVFGHLLQLLTRVVLFIFFYVFIIAIISNGKLHSNTNFCIYIAPLISDIAVFVLKRDVKLQLTNYTAPPTGSLVDRGHITNKSACSLVSEHRLKQGNHRSHFARAVHSHHPLPGQSHLQRMQQRRNDPFCSIMLLAIK